MSTKDLRIKRFEQRLQKTHDRFGYISLEAIVNSYFTHRKQSTDFMSVKRAELLPIGTSTANIPLERLEQLRRALHKANEAQKLKRYVA
ncbi:hypothetical protein L4C31_20490 [Aliivibrio sifiae]